MRAWTAAPTAGPTPRGRRDVAPNDALRVRGAGVRHGADGGVRHQPRSLRAAARGRGRPHPKGRLADLPADDPADRLLIKLKAITFVVPGDLILVGVKVLIFAVSVHLIFSPLRQRVGGGSAIEYIRQTAKFIVGLAVTSLLVISLLELPQQADFIRALLLKATFGAALAWVFCKFLRIIFQPA